MTADPIKREISKLNNRAGKKQKQGGYT